MANTNWQDPQTREIRSTDISGLQEAVSKLEQSMGMETVAETNIPLTEVYISAEDRYRIFQAPEGKRNWVFTPAPIIKKYGTVITTGFAIDYGAGAIALEVNDTDEHAYTANVTYVTPLDTSLNEHLTSSMPHLITNLKTNKTYRYGYQVSADGIPQIISEEVI